MDVQLEPILSLPAGRSILAIPKFLNFLVAIYLILIGVSGLRNRSDTPLRSEESQQRKEGCHA